MLETTAEATEMLLHTANLSNFTGRMFLLRRVSASQLSKKHDLGNAKFSILFDNNSTICELFGYATKKSFQLYTPLLKLLLGDTGKKIGIVKKLELPKQPTTVYVSTESVSFH
jgi:hypothetical protein